jgi:hypothetical protein
MKNYTDIHIKLFGYENDPHAKKRVTFQGKYCRTFLFEEDENFLKQIIFKEKSKKLPRSNSSARLGLGSGLNSHRFLNQSAIKSKSSMNNSVLPDLSNDYISKASFRNISPDISYNNSNSYRFIIEQGKNQFINNNMKDYIENSKKLINNVNSSNNTFRTGKGGGGLVPGSEVGMPFLGTKLNKNNSMSRIELTENTKKMFGIDKNIIKQPKLDILKNPKYKFKYNYNYSEKNTNMNTNIKTNMNGSFNKSDFYYE